MKTPSQQLKDSLEEFDEHFAIGQGRKWIFTIEEAEEVKHFLTTHTIKLLEAEIEVLEGMKKEIGEHGENLIEIIKTHQAIGNKQALTDCISHLQEQIIKIKE